jgi:hypothetical protein
MTERYPKDFITLAHSIHEFKTTGHRYADRTQCIDDILPRIIEKFPIQARAPSEGRSRSSSIDRLVTTAAERQRNPFPPEWAVDRPLFQAAVRRFALLCDTHFPSVPPQQNGGPSQLGRSEAPNLQPPHDEGAIAQTIENTRRPSRTISEDTEDISRGTSSG